MRYIIGFIPLFSLAIRATASSFPCPSGWKRIDGVGPACSRTTTTTTTTTSYSSSVTAITNATTTTTTTTTYPSTTATSSHSA